MPGKNPQLRNGLRVSCIFRILFFLIENILPLLSVGRVVQRIRISDFGSDGEGSIPSPITFKGKHLIYELFYWISLCLV